MKKKELIPNSEKKALEQAPVINILLLAKADLTAFYSTTLDVKQNQILSALEYRNKEEKISFLDNDIKLVRENLEADEFYYLYNIFRNNLTYIRKLASVYSKAKNAIAKLVPQDKKELFEGSLCFIIEMIASKKAISKKDSDTAIKHLKLLSGESKAIESIINDDDPIEAICAALMGLHAQRDYLNFLVLTREGIMQNTSGAIEAITETSTISKEFTTARQVLVVHYLMDELNVYPKTDKTEIARLIQMLTGKETNALKISDTNIYKYLKNPLSKNDKALDSDLRFVRNYFEKLGLKNIADKITKEIGSKE